MSDKTTRATVAKLTATQRSALARARRDHRDPDERLRVLVIGGGPLGIRTVNYRTVEALAAKGLVTVEDFRWSSNGYDYRAYLTDPGIAARNLIREAQGAGASNPTADREQHMANVCLRVERSLRAEATSNGRTLYEHATDARITGHINDVLSNGEWDGPVSMRFRGDALKRVREAVVL